MRKFSTFIFLIAGVLLLLGLFGVLSDRGTLITPPPQDVQASVNGFVPAVLSIPSIGVQSRVELAGVNQYGHMESPSSHTIVNWFAQGFAPGEDGNAVFSGHLDNRLGMAGVFANLHKLQQGDIIEIMGAEGEKLQYRVSALDTYGYRSAPTEEIFGEADTSRIRLITCSGAWLSEFGLYENRRVVTADLVESIE